MDHIIYIIISRDRSLTLKIRHTTLPHLRLLWWKRKIGSNFFLPTITCCLPDILHWQSGKVSEMNCDKPNKSLTEQVCKAKKSGAVARLQQEPATNDDDWVAPKFPPFWPLFAAILSTLILTLPPPARQWWDPTNEKWYDYWVPVFSSLTNLIHCFPVFSSISVLYLTSPPSDCRLIKKFHFLPKMETSPSSPRINQTWGEEKWKCENRKSHTKYEFFEEDGFQKIWVRWVASGGAGQSVAAHWKKNTGIGSSYTQQLGEIRN